MVRVSPARVVDVVGRLAAPWSGLSKVEDKPVGVEATWKTMRRSMVPAWSVPSQAPMTVEGAGVWG